MTVILSFLLFFVMPAQADEHTQNQLKVALTVLARLEATLVTRNLEFQEIAKAWRIETDSLKKSELQDQVNQIGLRRAELIQKIQTVRENVGNLKRSLRIAEGEREALTSDASQVGTEHSTQLQDLLREIRLNDGPYFESNFRLKPWQKVFVFSINGAHTVGHLFQPDPSDDRYFSVRLPDGSDKIVSRGFLAPAVTKYGELKPGLSVRVKGKTLSIVTIFASGFAQLNDGSIVKTEDFDDVI